MPAEETEVIVDPVTPVESAEDANELSAIEKGLSEAEGRHEEHKEVPPAKVKPAENDDVIPEAVVTPDKKTGDADEDFLKTIEEIQPAKNAHPNIKKGIGALKDIAKQEREERKKAQDDLKKAQEELKNARLITPEIEQQLEEARLLLRSEKPESDPEIQQKYFSPLNDTQAKITQILKEGGAKDDLISFIDKNGGLAAMAVSSNKMTWKDKSIPMAEWVESVVLPKLPSAIQRARVQSLLTKSIDLMEERDAAIESAKKEAPERAKKKQEENTKKFSDAVKAATEQLGDEAKIWEVPQEATPEQKKNIELHNQRVTKAQESFQQYLKDGNNPEKVAKMMVDASHSQYLLEVNSDLQSQIKERDNKIQELETRMGKLKGSASTARRSNTPPPKPAKDQGKLVSDTQAVDNFFKEQDNQ